MSGYIKGSFSFIYFLLLKSQTDLAFLFARLLCLFCFGGPYLDHPFCGFY